MGDLFSCARGQESAAEITTAITHKPRVTTVFRKVRRADCYLYRPIAIAHHFHARILKEIELHGMATTHLKGLLNPTGLDTAIDWTLQMSDPFSELCQHLRDKGLTPEIAVEKFPRSPTGFRVIALSASEDVDWISTLFMDPMKLPRLSNMCDFSLHNDGRMLIIHPHQVKTTPDGSLASISTQYGSMLSLARDCNWDTTRAVPRSTLQYF